jgi:hypothetical protein
MTWSVVVSRGEIMKKFCCLVQRQDSHVMGLVKVVDKKPDLTTARFICGDFDPNEDLIKQASRHLLQNTGVRSDNEMKFVTLNVNGTDHDIVDMDYKRPISPKSSDSECKVMWVNPWHLANGPDAALARAVFDFNKTRVAQPPEYLHRTNKQVVIEEDE